MVKINPSSQLYTYTFLHNKLQSGTPKSMDFSTAVISLLTLLCIVFYYLQKQQKEDVSEQKNSSMSSSLDQQRSLHEEQHGHKKDTFSSSLLDNQCRRFSLTELKLATNDFDDTFVIGKGGFGNVYKGRFDFGEGIDVAIKRLNLDSNQGATEFRAEIEMLSKFRHSHILSLLGYHEGSHEGEMILVYEYMPNGSLEDHLHKRRVNGSNCAVLTWEQRLHICIGAARGLDYLHTGTSVQSRVIHRDVKSSNILLDENLAAKISDFGLSRISPANQSGTTNVYTDFIRGTFGYMDAEYFATHRVTRKSDVYAFGVVLLEVLCGRPALDFTLDEEKYSLAVWAKECIKEGNIDRIIDPCLRGQTTGSCLNEFGQIAYECLLTSSKDRPTMTKVVARLEFVLALGSQKHGGVTIAAKVWSLFYVKNPVHAKNYRSRQKWSNGNESKRDILDKAATTVAGGGYEGKDNGIILVGPTKPAAQGRNDNINKSVTMLKAQSSSSQMGTQNLKIFTLNELWRATGKFLPPPMLGVSDRVSVYKGWVTSESYTPSAFDVPEAIVIKHFNTNVAKYRKKWQEKAEYMERFSHPNVLKLLGYGWGSNEIHLVYECTEKGSLYMHLFREDAEPLPWDTRIKIAMGAAQGLAFLHTEMYVICRDVRSSNILLDGEFNAKLTDFGEGGFNPVSGESPVLRRTPDNDGYVAPEYQSTGWLYLKSDVYGFGVVMLELITGLRAVDAGKPYLLQNLVDWARPSLTSKKLQNIIDPRLEQLYPSKGAMKLAQLIVKCLHYDPDYRPSMEKVVARLEEINSIKIKPESL